VGVLTQRTIDRESSVHFSRRRGVFAEPLYCIYLVSNFYVSLILCIQRTIDARHVLNCIMFETDF
jgi:hypothetical protein